MIETLASLVSTGGVCTHCTVGADDRITTVITAGVGSTFPARSTALTFNVMSPCSSDETSTMPPNPTAEYTAVCALFGDDDSDDAVLNMTTRMPDTALLADTFSVR